MYNNFWWHPKIGCYISTSVMRYNHCDIGYMTVRCATSRCKTERVISHTYATLQLQCRKTLWITMNDRLHQITADFCLMASLSFFANWDKFCDVAFAAAFSQIAPHAAWFCMPWKSLALLTFLSVYGNDLKTGCKHMQIRVSFNNCRRLLCLPHICWCCCRF